jgi:aryl-alcohol dehydrogenase-like predicted oxidoreductase
MSLPTRKIGQHTVSALGYGAMSLGDAYGSAGSDEDRQKVRFLPQVVLQTSETSHYRC